MDDERWEHRAWFDGPAGPLDLLAAQGEPLGDAYRTDTYLLTAAPDILTKLRGGERFEVKRRLEVRDGLERWVLDAALDFPLGAGAADAVLPGAPAHALADAEALRAYAASLPGAMTVAVRKHRRRYRLDRAEAEATAVMADGRVAETLGIEAASLDAAREAARRLGVIGLPNRDYGAWLRG